MRTKRNYYLFQVTTTVHMGIVDWAKETIEYTRTHGVFGLKNAYHELMKGVLQRVGRYWNYGENIYKEDWDTLVVLDACRVDAMNAVASEYNFLDNVVPTHVSNASTSEEWMRKNLDRFPEYTNNLCYISANPNDKFLDDSKFSVIERVYEDQWSEELNTTPTRAVTDAAIETHRSHPDNRLLVHYMQPHAPYIPSGRRSPFMDVKLGEISKEELWEEYLDTLRYVLDDVEILLKNIDSETVVITADHGEAWGEWGVYGHRGHVPVRGLKEVPWSRTTATDTGNHQPETDSENTSDSNSVKEKLEALGYR